MYRKLSLCLLVLLLVLGAVSPFSCSALDAEAAPAFSVPPEPADMSGYGLSESDPCFVQISLPQAVEFFRSGGTGLLLFTADWCPFCQYAVPLLEEALQGGETFAYLVDADAVDHETEAEDYAALCDILAAALEPHPDGSLLDIPEVLAVKDGQIVGHHYALLPSFRTPQVRAREEMSPEQKAELRGCYAALLPLLAEEAAD